MKNISKNRKPTPSLCFLFWDYFRGYLITISYVFHLRRKLTAFPQWGSRLWVWLLGPTLFRSLHSQISSLTLCVYIYMEEVMALCLHKQSLQLSLLLLSESKLFPNWRSSGWFFIGLEVWRSHGKLTEDQWRKPLWGMHFYFSLFSMFSYYSVAFSFSFVNKKSPVFTKLKC